MTEIEFITPEEFRIAKSLWSKAGGIYSQRDGNLFHSLRRVDWMDGICTATVIGKTDPSFSPPGESPEVYELTFYATKEIGETLKAIDSSAKLTELILSSRTDRRKFLMVKLETTVSRFALTAGELKRRID